MEFKVLFRNNANEDYKPLSKFLSRLFKKDNTEVSLPTSAEDTSTNETEVEISTTDNSIPVNTTSHFRNGLSAKILRDKLCVNLFSAHHSHALAEDDTPGTIFNHFRIIVDLDQELKNPNKVTTFAPWHKNWWEAPIKGTIRENLKFVRDFSEKSMKHANGLIFYCPEKTWGGWPNKFFNPAICKDPYLSGKSWAKAALETFEPRYGNRMVIMTGNEMFSVGQLDFNNKWRQGVVDAHKEFRATLTDKSTCPQIGLGCRRLKGRNFGGMELEISIHNIPVNILEYINSVGGWCNAHPYPEKEDDYKVYPHSLEEAWNTENFQDYIALSKWLKKQYPNIKLLAGEFSWERNDDQNIVVEGQKIKDWKDYKEFILKASEYADCFSLYQAYEQAKPEGRFTGSGLLPELTEQLLDLSKMKIK